MTDEELALVLKTRTALTQALDDAEAFGHGFVQVRRSPDGSIDIERLDPETVMVEPKFEPGDRAPEPENFE